jgi:hypothetical protein
MAETITFDQVFSSPKLNEFVQAHAEKLKKQSTWETHGQLAVAGASQLIGGVACTAVGLTMYVAGINAAAVTIGPVALCLIGGGLTGFGAVVTLNGIINLLRYLWAWVS